MRFRSDVGGVLALVSLTGFIVSCGEPVPTKGPLVLTGAINGIFRPGLPSSCGPGVTTVSGLYGPDRTADTASLTVDDHGRVSFDAGPRGSYSGTGVGFRPPAGWDIDSDLAGGVGQQIHLHGHLPC